MKTTAGSSILSIVLIASLLSATAPGVFAQSAIKAPRNKREFVAKSHAEWTALNFTGPCGGASSAGGVISNACAEAAIEQTASECGGSARFFERSSTSWQVVNLLMILASAGFTAVGASTTIANARLFATLGGTTGLGAITTTINANSSADAAGLTAVNTTLANFLIFLKSGVVPGAIVQQPAPSATDGTGATGPSGAGNTAPDNATIYKFAPVFAAQCEAAATSSGK
jgi:hypothetical protein